MKEAHLLCRCPYAVLNVKIDSNDDDIKDAYKRLSLLLHPDKRLSVSERQAAQESFIELTNAYDVLSNKMLRQAYDHFGFFGVSIVRHNPHESDSLFNHLSKLHEDGNPSEALRVLKHVLEGRKLATQKEMDFNADINVDLHLCGIHEGSGMERLEVKSTNISLSTSLPMRNQHKEIEKQQREQTVKVSVGGQSDVENGLSSTKSVLAATYQPRAETDVTSELVIDRKHMETTLSSTHLLANQTRLSAKMTRSYDWESSQAGKLSFGFSSNRTLTMFQGRTVHAMFAFGVGSKFNMQYGILTLVTWGWDSRTTSQEEEDEDEDLNHGDNANTENHQNNRNPNEQKLPPPRLSAKLMFPSQLPLEFSIFQNNVFYSPLRSCHATLSWCPLTGLYRIKGMINRKISTSYNASGAHEERRFSGSLGFGLEHLPMSGLKWLLRYEHPDKGVTIQIPIFVSSFLSQSYLNDVVWWSALSFLVDETIGELVQTQTSTDPSDSSIHSKCNTIYDKMTANRDEQQWFVSSKAAFHAVKQASNMRPIAALKRNRETARNGLVIIRATYYRQESAPGASIDVTEQLQFFVHNSCLVLPASSKSMLLGFSQFQRDRRQIRHTISDHKSMRSYASKMKAFVSRLWIHDCCKDEHAQEEVMLTVRYKFKGDVFETTVRDNGSLQIPCNNDLNLGPSYLVS